MEEWRFDHLDAVQVKIILGLKPEQRLQLMLSTRQVLKGFIWSRVQRQYPDLSDSALGLKFIEEIVRVNRLTPFRYIP